RRWWRRCRSATWAWWRCSRWRRPRCRFWSTSTWPRTGPAPRRPPRCCCSRRLWRCSSSSNASSAGGTVLIVDGIEYRYEGASFRFDLEVSRGEVLCVIGPSGAGKSTLLYLVAGFLAPVSGRIVIDGADVTALPPESRPVTTVFQEHNLFPHLTVFDNVALGVSPALNLDATARRRVGEALERVHLAGLDHRRPGELSGGQRQRVTLARALVRQRPVLLLDEPFTALGPAL